MPINVPGQVRERLEPISLLVLDVDGVLTDGRLYFTPRGEELKSFSVRDGLGIKLLMKAGISIAVITGRTSMSLALRCRELGIESELVVQGSKDKVADLERIQRMVDATDAQTAAIGDDLPDLPLLARVGFSACPNDAVPEVLAVCDFVCGVGGGQGAVRELAELILKAQSKWTDLAKAWVRVVPGQQSET